MLEEKFMKLSQWAKQQGISYRTAYQWCKDDNMPCEFIRTKTGTIIVYENTTNHNNIKKNDKII